MIVAYVIIKNVVLEPPLGNLERKFKSRLRGKVSRKSFRTGSLFEALRQLFFFERPKVDVGSGVSK